MTENNDNQEKNIYTFVIKKIMKSFFYKTISVGMGNSE